LRIVCEDDDDDDDNDDGESNDNGNWEGDDMAVMMTISLVWDCTFIVI
jgi:hypothetical protein